MSKAVVFLADGLEECEGLLVIDILRRGGVEVVTASIMESKQIMSSHNIPITADAMADEVDYDSADMVVYPGGLKGSENLAASKFACDKALEFAGAGKYVAAICAAPALVLAPLGLTAGKKATCHPSFQPKLKENCAELLDTNVVVDGKLITARALGAAIPFGLELLALLEGRDAARKVTGGIVYPWE